MTGFLPLRSLNSVMVVTLHVAVVSYAVRSFLRPTSLAGSFAGWGSGAVAGSWTWSQSMMTQSMATGAAGVLRTFMVIASGFMVRRWGRLRYPQFYAERRRATRPLASFTACRSGARAQHEP